MQRNNKIKVNKSVTRGNNLFFNIYVWKIFVFFDICF